MDVSKLKECFLSIAAAASLHAGAAVELARGKRDRMHVRARRQKKVTSQILAPETKCHRMSCTWVPHGSALPHLLAFCCCAQQRMAWSGLAAAPGVPVPADK